MKLGKIAYLVLPIALLACSAEDKPQVPNLPSGSSGSSGGTAGGGKDGGATKTATKPTTKVAAKSVKSYAGSKPPTGATSKGKQATVKAANSVIPITNVEVYVFQFDYDDNGSADDISWAHVDGKTYLWAEGPVACSDGQSDGTGGFVAEVNEDGSGAYLFSVDACPQNDLFGCQFDTEGNETTCGACSWNDTVIACVASDGQ
jgi:hypothetical protein